MHLKHCQNNKKNYFDNVIFLTTKITKFVMQLSAYV